jgi:hypothetical protein
MLKKLRSKLPKRRAWRPRAEVFDSYVSSVPRPQNAIDAIGGWSSAFPPGCGVSAGELEAYRDSRIRWAIDCFGPLEGRSVLELAPGEAGHTFLLDSAGAHVDAIEPSRSGFIRCLVAKEVMHLTRSRFWLGDIERFLRDTDKPYDFVVACDALRRFADPLAAVGLIARRADAIFIHTQIAPPKAEAAPVGESEGAPLPRRDDLIDAFYKAGYSDIRELENGASAALSLFARK